MKCPQPVVNRGRASVAKPRLREASPHPEPTRPGDGLACGSHRLDLAVGQESNASPILRWNPREESNPRSGSANDDAALWPSVTFVHNSVGLDHAKPRVVFDELRDLPALGVGFSLEIEVARQPGGGNGAIAEEDSVVMRGVAAVRKQQSLAGGAAQPVCEARDCMAHVV